MGVYKLRKMYETMEFILKHCNNDKLEKLVSQNTQDNKPIKCVYMVLDELKTTINSIIYKNKTNNYVETIDRINNLMTYIENSGIKDEDTKKIKRKEIRDLTNGLMQIEVEFTLSS